MARVQVDLLDCCGMLGLCGFDSSPLLQNGVIKSWSEAAYSRSLTLATTVPYQREAIRILEENGFRPVLTFVNKGRGDRVVTLWGYGEWTLAPARPFVDVLVDIRAELKKAEDEIGEGQPVASVRRAIPLQSAEQRAGIPLAGTPYNSDLIRMIETQGRNLIHSTPAPWPSWPRKF